jgi:hypothetical protein
VNLQLSKCPCRLLRKQARSDVGFGKTPLAVWGERAGAEPRQGLRMVKGVAVTEVIGN